MEPTKMKDHLADDVFINASSDRLATQADLLDGETLTMAAALDSDEATEAVDRMENGVRGSQRAGEKTQTSGTNAWDWNTDPENPYNWKTSWKWAQVAMCASFAIVA